MSKRLGQRETIPISHRWFWKERDCHRLVTDLWLDDGVRSFSIRNCIGATSGTIWTD